MEKKSVLRKHGAIGELLWDSLPFPLPLVEVVAEYARVSNLIAQSSRGLLGRAGCHGMNCDNLFTATPSTIVTFGVVLFPGGDVHLTARTVEEIIFDELGMPFFRDYTKAAFASSDVEFCVACADYRRLAQQRTNERRWQELKTIFDKNVSDHAPDKVYAMKTHHAVKDLYKKTTETALDGSEFDSMYHFTMRFLNSILCKFCQSFQYIQLVAELVSYKYVIDLNGRDQNEWQKLWSQIAEVKQRQQQQQQQQQQHQHEPKQEQESAEHEIQIASPNPSWRVVSIPVSPVASDGAQLQLHPQLQTPQYAHAQTGQTPAAASTRESLCAMLRGCACCKRS